jgi:hypothetical protein
MAFARDDEDEDSDRFQKAIGSVAGRRLTYDELTGQSSVE